jgi:hypothetical protein
MLLPGYVTVILAMLLFFPSFIPGFVTGGNPNNQNIPFEVFSVVVFIIAGPSVGFILWQIYFHISSFSFFLTRDEFNRKYEFQRIFGRLRIICSDIERAELDSVESRHIFGMSTSVGLLIIGLYALLFVFVSQPLSPEIKNDLGLLGLHTNIAFSGSCLTSFIDAKSKMCNDQLRAVIVSLTSFVVSAILFFGAYFYDKRVRLPLICRMMQSYHLEPTLTCSLRLNALKYRQKKEACKLIQEFFREKFSLKENKPGKNIKPIELRDQIEQYLVDSNKFDAPLASNMIDILKKENFLDLDEAEKQYPVGLAGKYTKVITRDEVIESIIHYKHLMKNKSNLGNLDRKARIGRIGYLFIDECHRKLKI